MGGVEVETEVEVLRFGAGPRGGGRALVYCPACGRRCYTLFPNQAAITEPWRETPQPITIATAHRPGWFKLPVLQLRYGARQIGWACRACSGTRGLDERAGHERRLRHLVEKLRSHAMFGRRREGRSWAEEYRRQERLARAEAELARLERRGLKTMARVAGFDPALL